MSDNPPLTRAPVASPAEAPESRAAGLPQLVLLLAASCFPVLGAVLIAPVLPQMAGHFAATRGVVVLTPLALAVPALLIGITAPFAGIIADRINRKRILLVAMAAYAVAGTAPLYLESLEAIIGSRVLLGVCEAAIMTCVTTLIGDYWAGHQRARYLGMQTLVAAIAATVFLALGGALGEVGWRAPFGVYAVAAVLVVPMARLLWDPQGDTQTAVARLEPLAWRQILRPCLVTLFGGAVFYALIVQLSFVLTEVGMGSTAAIGGITAVMSLATAVGAGLMGRLSSSSPRVLVPVEFGLAAVGLGVISLSGGAVPVIVVGAVITGFGTGLLLPTLLLWAVNRLTFEQRGRGTGLWTGALFLGEFLSPLLIAAIGAGAGGLRPALGVLGLAAAVMAGVVWLVARSDTHQLR
ncbi:MFS transporter [Antribacter sp. KLBMP9083]|uniref:MFS transporter n=1 Tax=Antribacter soli TaxID=2910976 RepID=A0AA41QF87_9MICO|nr:MFS transporter [Antribacter soli]MCF4121077.1 MFS transporter [Antribacter soli]